MRIRLALIVLVLSLAGFVVWVSFFKDQLTKQSNLPSKSTLSSGKLRRFANQEEFETYMRDGQNQLAMPLSLSPVTDQAQTSIDRAETQKGIETPDYSQTNIQVQGVDEADIVKSDGTNLYYSPSNTRFLLEKVINGKVWHLQTDSRSAAKIQGQVAGEGELLLDAKHLMVISPQKIAAYPKTELDNTKISWQIDWGENTYLLTSRLIDDRLLVILKQTRWGDDCLIPLAKQAPYTIACTDVYYPGLQINADALYTVLLLNPDDGTVILKSSFVGSSQDTVVYVSPEHLYLAYQYDEGMFDTLLDFYLTQGSSWLPETLVNNLKALKTLSISQAAKLTELSYLIEGYRRTLDEDALLKLETQMGNALSGYLSGKLPKLSRSLITKINTQDLKIINSGEIGGHLLNQFAIDEDGDYLRVASTLEHPLVGSEFQESLLTVLDQNLQVVGYSGNLGLGERIYSVRFIGDRAYIVTFKETDPFYVMDLKNPRQPKVVGELKLPGFSSYLHPLEDNLILGIGRDGSEVKLSLFEVSDPQNLQEPDRYLVPEGYSQVLDNHRAFLTDPRHQLFFIPGSRGGYVFDYQNKALKLVHTVAQTETERALWINDLWYFFHLLRLVLTA